MFVFESAPAESVSLLDYLALAATLVLGLIAAVLAGVALVFGLQFWKRLQGLEKRVDANEEIARMAERRVDLTVSVITEIRRFLNSLDYELRNPILDSPQLQTIERHRAELEQTLQKCVSEFDLFHYDPDRRHRALRDLAHQNGDEKSMDYIETIRDIRRMSDQPGDKAEREDLTKHLNILKKRLYQRPTR